MAAHLFLLFLIGIGSGTLFLRGVRYLNLRGPLLYHCIGYLLERAKNRTDEWYLWGDRFGLPALQNLLLSRGGRRDLSLKGSKIERFIFGNVGHEQEDIIHENRKVLYRVLGWGGGRTSSYVRQTCVTQLGKRYSLEYLRPDQDVALNADWSQSATADKRQSRPTKAKLRS